MHGSSVGEYEGKDYLSHLGIDEWITLKYVLQKGGVRTLRGLHLIQTRF